MPFPVPYGERTSPRRHKLCSLISPINCLNLLAVDLLSPPKVSTLGLYVFEMLPPSIEHLLSTPRCTANPFPTTASQFYLCSKPALLPTISPLFTISMPILLNLVSLLMSLSLHPYSMHTSLTPFNLLAWCSMKCPTETLLPGIL